MAVIDIGSGAIDRNWYGTTGRTYIDVGNPANDTGTITSFEIWAYSNMSNVECATFLVVSGNNLSTRDSEAIGSVTAGSKQTFSGLSMDVATGDYLGFYHSAGLIERDTATGNGYWYASGDYIPCTNQAFSLVSTTTAISLYGEGATGAAGWSGEYSGVAVAEFDGVTPAEIDGV